MFLFPRRDVRLMKSALFLSIDACFFAHPSARARGHQPGILHNRTRDGGKRCRAYIFPMLKTFRLTFLRMRDKYKIINVQRKDNAFMV